jgi:uncharacterized protein YukE
MRDLRVNRSTYPAYFKKCKNLGQLISLMEKEGENDKLFIITLHLNGKKMDQDEEKLLDNLGINEVDELRVRLGSMSEIVSQSLASIIASIQSIQMRAIQFAREFRQAGSVDQEKVKYLLINCRQMIDGLEEVFRSHASKKFTIKHHSLWLESEKELTNILHIILQGLNQSQATFMSDLLEYDLVHALDCWEETLEKELLENSLLKGNFSLNPMSDSSNNGVDA